MVGLSKISLHRWTLNILLLETFRTLNNLLL